MGKALASRFTISIGAALVVSQLAGCATGPETKIQTTVASYGYAGNRKNVKDDVAKFCDGKTSCSFAVKNETFTLNPPVDPSPGDDKSIVYKWKCGDESRSGSAAEGHPAKLSCS